MLTSAGALGSLWVVPLFSSSKTKDDGDSGSEIGNLI